MERRDLIKSGLVAAAGTLIAHPSLIAGSGAGPDASDQAAHGRVSVSGGQAFRLRYAPHFGMFEDSAGADPLDQLRFIAEHGFGALEDNGMRERPVAEQERIAREMARLGLAMGVFVAHTIHWREPNLTSGRQDWREEFLSDIRAAVEVARRTNATWMTVVPGHVDLRRDFGYQTANVIGSLRRAADILEPHGLVMVLEPLNFFNHPGLFLTKVSQAYEICRAVDSPACKILNDLYHQQVTEGNLIPNIDAAWDEIAYFQIGDNPGRNEPGSGEINYRNVFRHIHEMGYTGLLGMEHGNSRPGPEGELAVIAAYREVDDF